MFVRRWNPTYAFPELRQEMDRVFNHLFGNGGTRSMAAAPAFPAVNLWEDGERFYAEAEVPGVNLNDLEIFAVGDELTLKGRRPSMDDRSVAYHRQERGVGEFSRLIHLPAKVNSEKVEASIKDGVLTVVMPKAEAAKARKIQVQVG